ncbi:MAG: alanine--tRNA ligase, partial [Saprospiraceae bacterium]|nr:alanine--tRNA ligase [Saprospiraceae bacterium]
KDHPQVIEIWNLVFIQFDRKQDGSLVELPAKHIDTGMGFERLCMTIQGKLSSYDSDIFTPYIKFIEEASGVEYKGSYAADAKSDIAMRVLTDHLRAVSFTIADGALPSSTGPGYVVRRILRRAVRYYYSFLHIQEPFLHRMVPMLAKQFSQVFPELAGQEDFVTKVIMEEERSFLNTLESGLKRFDAMDTSSGKIDGQDAFELYDTYGFPIDLTRLISSERGLVLDEEGFQKALNNQRERARADAKKSVGDWQVIADAETTFVGYDQLVVEDTALVKYRTVEQKGEEKIQLVLASTPFYAEGGGQVGDQGLLVQGEEKVKVLDTVRENDLIIHLVDRLPSDPTGRFQARVQADRRRRIENNHSATHLLHAALRQVLGDHVTQKGSLVSDKYLRFDFSHFQRMTEEEKRRVEMMVNQKVRENIVLEEDRSIPIEEAKSAGAMMLFGEKYGDRVRMITFDPEYSRELCGGCHVGATGQLGFFKIVSESAVASGVRRIEAVTAEGAEAHVMEELDTLEGIRGLFKNPTQALQQVESLQQQNKALQKKIDALVNEQLQGGKAKLLEATEDVEGVQFLAQKVDAPDSAALKSLSYELEREMNNAVIVFAAVINEKPQLMITISKELVEGRGLHAGNMVRELAKLIRGGGGGQPFFATAGGSDASGIDQVLKEAKVMLHNSLS